MSGSNKKPLTDEPDVSSVRQLHTSGDDGARTHDPLLAKQVLFQLSYVPEF